ncbi:MAG: hypothetical protein B6245_11735 [Desulfobacteraceae bacterium 4572_88]|nr:MAG: hypothetical protein B6245_11735 [Desulfobacteraceae bacterium 4572_88]
MDAHILIVEDDVSIYRSMHSFIEMSGYSVSVAHSAEDALALLKASPVQVLITDIMLPGMDGLELTQAIRENYDADIIVITGYSDSCSYETAIEKGASDFIFKPVKLEELLLRLKRVLRERALEKEREQMLKKLREFAITDDLTQLYNSRHFYHQLKVEINRSVRYNHPLSLLFLDIDHFKRFNQKYLHTGGNKVLAKVSQLIRSNIRKTDMAFRYAGDEFTVILPETTGKEGEFVAQRISTAIKTETFYPMPGQTASITISTGVTEHCSEDDLSVFVQRADQAMFDAKKKGRNQVASLCNDKKRR